MDSLPRGINQGSKVKFIGIMEYGNTLEKVCDNMAQAVVYKANMEAQGFHFKNVEIVPYVDPGAENSLH